MSSITQKAYLYSKKGPGNSAVGEKPVPAAPEDKRLLVKVEAAGVNPVDWKITQYSLFVENFPAVLGSDVAGTVEAVGPNVTKFKKGDKVLFQGSFSNWDQGGFQQYVISSPEDLVSLVPSNITVDQAATLPATGFTAFVGLFDASGLAIPPPVTSTPVDLQSKVIFITGGASSIGRYAIQFAKLAGFTTIITTASISNAEDLKALGATHVFDRSIDNATLEKQIRGVIGNEELVYSFDPIGAAETQALAYALLSDKKTGTLATTLGVAQTESSPKKPEGTRWSSVYGSPTAHPDLGAQFYKSLKQWVETGKVKPNKVRVVPGGLKALDEAVDLAIKASNEKIVVRPQE